MTETTYSFVYDRRTADEAFHGIATRELALSVLAGAPPRADWDGCLVHQGTSPIDGPNVCLAARGPGADEVQLHLLEAFEALRHPDPRGVRRRTRRGAGHRRRSRRPVVDAEHLRCPCLDRVQRNAIRYVAPVVDGRGARVPRACAAGIRLPLRLRRDRQAAPTVDAAAAPCGARVPRACAAGTAAPQSVPPFGTSRKTTPYTHAARSGIRA